MKSTKLHPPRPPLCDLPNQTKVENFRRYSKLTVISDVLGFQCSVGGNGSTRNRWQLLMRIYNAILPHLESVEKSWIHHDHHLHKIDIFNHDELVELSLRQGLAVTDSSKELGYFIRGIRTKLSKTQEEFAKELGISSNYLSLLERAKRTPSRKLIQKISEIQA